MTIDDDLALLAARIDVPPDRAVAAGVWLRVAEVNRRTEGHNRTALRGAALAGVLGAAMAGGAVSTAARPPASELSAFAVVAEAAPSTALLGPGG